jgi:membrane peptidoglycan carboxypeptidase
VVEGGSTITQQYVKNTYVTGEQTLRRKLAEAANARGLERANAKAAILEAYLNTVYVGQGAYGVQAAAKTYFSSSAGRLTLPQAALLAGMIRAPVAYDPFRHPRAALARRATVLARLERHGHLRPAARARAATAPLGVRPGGPDGGGAARAPWFVGWVLDQLLDPADHRFDALGTSRRARTARMFTGGPRIATTVDLAAQAAAERAVASVVGRRGGDPYGAQVAVEPGTGAVRAMVGGRSWEGDPGSAGSTWPPGRRRRPARRVRLTTFALVAALERGIPPEAVFRRPRPAGDRPRRPGPAWRVANYEGHGFGHATQRSATALSINNGYAELLLRLGGGDADRGAAAMVRTAARLGVASPLRAVPSSVLGTNEVTPLEMAAACAALAAGGGGRPRSGCGGSPAPTARVLYQARPDPDQVLAPGVAAIAADVLREVVDHGTGVRGRIGRPADRAAGGRQDRHHPGPRRRLVRGLHPVAGRGRLGRLPPGAGADGAAADRQPGLGRDLAGGHLGRVHARRPGRPARRPLPPARHPAGRGRPGRGAGLPAQPVHPGGRGRSVVYLKAAAPTRTCREPEGRWPGWSRRWSGYRWPGRPAGWRRPGCRWPSGCE